jgi:hypothetical protein
MKIPQGALPLASGPAFALHRSPSAIPNHQPLYTWGILDRGKLGNFQLTMTDCSQGRQSVDGEACERTAVGYSEEGGLLKLAPSLGRSRKVLALAVAEKPHLRVEAARRLTA